MKTFEPIKNKRPWLPILISLPFQQGLFSSLPVCFGLDLLLYCVITNDSLFKNCHTNFLKCSEDVQLFITRHHLTVIYGDKQMNKQSMDHFPY